MHFPALPRKQQMTSPLSVVVYGAFGVGPLRERKMTYYLAGCCDDGSAVSIPPGAAHSLHVVSSPSDENKSFCTISHSPIPTNTVDKLRESSSIELFRGTDSVSSSTVSGSVVYGTTETGNRIVTATAQRFRTFWVRVHVPDLSCVRVRPWDRLSTIFSIRRKR